MKYVGRTGCLSMLLGLLMSCSPQEPVSEQTLKGCPAILPDYTGVTIPSNIAPLRFALEEEAEKAVAVISGRKDKLIVDAEDGSFQYLYLQPIITQYFATNKSEIWS